MTSQPPPYVPVSPPEYNPSAVKSLWPLTSAIAALFIVNIVIRVLTVTNTTEQIDAVTAFRKSQSILDFARIQDADNNVTPLMIGTAATWFAAAILLAVWTRSVVANHRALGRVDDRFRARRGTKAPSVFDFAGTAAMAMRGTTEANVSSGVSKSQRFSGCAPAAWWMRVFTAALIISIVGSNFTRSKSVDDIDEVLNKFETGRNIMAVVVGLLVISAALGIYVMAKVAQSQAASASGPTAQAG